MESGRGIWCDDAGPCQIHYDSILLALFWLVSAAILANQLPGREVSRVPCGLHGTHGQHLQQRCVTLIEHESSLVQLKPESALIACSGVAGFQALSVKPGSGAPTRDSAFLALACFLARAAASGPLLLMVLGKMSLLSIETFPKVATSYADVGLAVEKSRACPLPWRVGASGVWPKYWLPTLLKGGRMPSKKAFDARSASSCAACAGVSM